MALLSERCIIIQKINKELVSECITGQPQEWWLKSTILITKFLKIFIGRRHNKRII